MASYFPIPEDQNTSGPSYHRPDYASVHPSRFHDITDSVSSRGYYDSSAKSSPKHASGYFEQLAGIGLGLGNLLAENVLSHPCIVVRRQCQVNYMANSYHLTPFTIVPVVFNLQQNQGPFCLWKGVGGRVIIRFLNAISDRILADVLGLPREISRHSSVKKAMKHFILKSISFALTTTFTAASFIETVQSDVASERPAVLECISEGLTRLKSDIFGPRDTRRISIWLLVGPATVYQLMHYIASGICSYFMRSAIKRQILRKPQRQRSLFDEFFPDLFASFTSSLLADAILFPVETVIHRLYIQGTRTIVDNLDTGMEVIPINSRFEGPFDCARSILSEEGAWGFYKGFGALVLQYLLHFGILRLTRFIFEQIEEAKRSGDGNGLAQVGPEDQPSSSNRWREASPSSNFFSNLPPSFTPGRASVTSPRPFDGSALWNNIS